jgi:hypothetical protein
MHRVIHTGFTCFKRVMFETKNWNVSNNLGRHDPQNNALEISERVITRKFEAFLLRSKQGKQTYFNDRDHSKSL